MFNVLPASDAHLHIKSRWATTSILAHALAIALAIVATKGALQGSAKPVAEDALLMFVPLPAEPASEHEPESPRTPLVEPPRTTFQTLPLPSEIPEVIPSLDLNRRPFDPRDFTGTEIVDRLVDGGNTVGTARPNGMFAADTTLQGFEPAVLLFQPTPVYPSTLRSAGLNGAVTIEFVVDTSGRVEAGSLRVIESAHRLFEDAARAAVLSARFQPARLGVHRVRQLTRQRVRFLPGP